MYKRTFFSFSRQVNFFLSTVWVLEALAYINSAFNIAVYYFMGSKFRETFWTLFGRGGTRKGVGNVKQPGSSAKTGVSIVSG
jgi:hypothetical protein